MEDVLLLFELFEYVLQCIRITHYIVELSLFE